MSPLPLELFKQALDNSLDIVMITQANFDDVGGSTIVYVNRAFCDTFGYQEHEVLGQSPRMLQGNETDKMTRMEIRVSLKHRKPVTSRILNYTKGGEPIWLDIHMVPLANAQGEVTHFFATERVVDGKTK
jgi:PAS domain S-box-containing protein